MKYDVLYHHTGGPYTMGVEVQPPFETEADWRLLTDRVNDRLKQPKLPKNLKGIGSLYCNGGSSQGTHFLAMPPSGERFTDIEPARGVASYVGYLLRRDGHEVTVAHQPEWDGELMGTRNPIPDQPQFVPESDPQLAIEPGSELPTPEPEV